jgi:hypothetical protein
VSVLAATRRTIWRTVSWLTPCCQDDRVGLGAMRVGLLMALVEEPEG